MFYILLIAYLLVGVFFAVLTNVILDDEDDVIFGLTMAFWPILIVLAALCGLTYAIIWSAWELGTWIRNKFMGDDVE